MDHNQGRRGHFHRGRRGPDRRGLERRGTPAEAVSRPERNDRVDVEQIMREIRGRIAQRSGIDLSNQQIQELAARRLEAILDPRGLKPELLDQLRRSAGERTVSVDAAAPAASQSYPFDEASLYDSPNGLLRFLRRLLNPILRMLFNPTPIAQALAVQSRLNAELATREGERDRRQAEWNALHCHRGLAREHRGAKPGAARRVTCHKGGLQRATRPHNGRYAGTHAATARSVPPCSVRRRPTARDRGTAAARAGRPRW